MTSYLSTAQVAKRLGLTTRSVARLVVAGRLSAATQAPGVRGAYLFDPAEVDRYAESRQATA